MKEFFDRCTIYESFYKFAQALATDADKGLFYTGIIEYSLYGNEPEFESALLSSCFGLIKPVIDSSNKKRTNGKKPKNDKEKADGKQDANDRQTNGKQTAKDIELELEQELELELNAGEVSPVSAFSFEQFWKAYEKPVDRAKCESKFKKINEAGRKLIKERLPAYIAATPDAQFRKNPLTYLNGKCWQDEPAPTEERKCAL